MALTRKAKVILVLIPLGLVALWQGWRGIQYAWYRGYSRGTRTGVVRKMSVKGPPFCKYVLGEMVLQGSLPGMPYETWEFSVDDERPDAPIMKGLHEAERAGERVTLQYRQDKKALFRCTPNEYFVIGIEK
jgi:hypothetical protein